jgi:VWFA-related protein
MVTGGSLRVMLLGSLLLAATFSGWVGAQDVPKFVDSIDVKVINIDVVVTDGKGRPVTGLARDDFELLINNEPVEISNFYEVSGRSLAVSTTYESAGDAVQPEPLPVAESQRTSIIILIDDSSLQLSGRKEAFATLREVLEEEFFGTGQPIMLARFDGNLDIFTDFTDEPVRIRAGIDQLEEYVPSAPTQRIQWAELLRLFELKAFEEPRHAEEAIKDYAASALNANMIKIKALKGFMESLAGLEGRKALLFVSDGIPVRVGESLFASLFRTGRGVSSHFSLKMELKSLAACANANRVTIYTINGGGWSAHNLSANSVAMSATQNYANRDIFTIADENHTESLQALAEDTGGRALRRASRQALEAVVRDLDAFYSLAFIPDDPGSTRFNRVKVKVPGKGLNLQYRRSFQLVSADDEQGDQAVAALLVEPTDDPLQISFEVGSSARQEKQDFLVPATIRIPTERLAFVPNGDEWRASVVIHVTSQSEGGKIADPIKSTLPIALPSDAYESGAVPEIVYDLELRASKGRIKVAVSVSDEHAGVTSSLSRDLDIDSSGAVAIQSQE